MKETRKGTVTPDGEKVRLLREEKGWTQRDLKEKAGVSKRTVENVEHGRPAFHKTLALIAGALGVDAQALLVMVPSRIGGDLSLRNQNFTGREELLHKVRGELTTAKKGASIVALCGMGGVGKTAVAFEYAYRYAEWYPRLIGWLRAGNPHTLAADYAALSQALNLPEKNDREPRITLQAVKQWLQQNTGWLLVFDDAPDKDSVCDYIPRGLMGHALVTSRRPDWNPFAKAIPVEVFKRDESLSFLRKYLEIAGDDQAVTTLCEELGDLPLALEQAAAYVKSTGTTVGRYLCLFRSRRHDLWEKEHPPHGYPHTVTTTWSLSMERTRQESLTAFDLLILSAFLGSKDIPRELFERGAECLPSRLRAAVQDGLAMDEAFSILHNYALAKMVNETLSVHPLVQAVVRDSLKSDQKRRWCQIALDMVSSVFPFKSEDERTWMESLRLLPHASAALRHAEDDGVATDSDGFRIGLFEAIARDMQGQSGATEMCEKILEDLSLLDAKSQAIARVWLAIFHDHQHNRRTALRILNDLLNEDDAQRRYNEVFWWGMYQKGVILLGMSLTEQAEEVLTTVYKTARWQAHQVAALHQLGVISLTRGDYNSAENRFYECLRRREELADGKTYRLAYEYRRLGQVYAQTGRREDAQRMFEQAIAIAHEHNFQRYVREIQHDLLAFIDNQR